MIKSLLIANRGLADKPDTYLLVWTTTPWTLPANVAVAAHLDVDYVTVEREHEGVTEKLILAKSLLEKVFRGEEVNVVDSFKGKKLKGVKYNPLFTFVPLDKPAHFVILGDFVTTEDGTGLVHQAPAFGAEDMEMAKQYDLPVLLTVQPDGTFIPEITPWRGVFVKDADPQIIQDLEARGLMFRAEKMTHTYPFCWRCHTPLLYYARDSWYIRTSAKKENLVNLNKTDQTCALTAWFLPMDKAPSPPPDRVEAQRGNEEPRGGHASPSHSKEKVQITQASRSPAAWHHGTVWQPSRSGSSCQEPTIGRRLSKPADARRPPPALYPF